jgi:hypothetical protein
MRVVTGEQLVYTVVQMYENKKNDARYGNTTTVFHLQVKTIQISVLQLSAWWTLGVLDSFSPESVRFVSSGSKTGNQGNGRTSCCIITTNVKMIWSISRLATPSIISKVIFRLTLNTPDC